MSLVFWAVGIISILLFHEEIYLPIVVSAGFIVLSAMTLIALYQKSRVGPLTMLLFLVYALPFIHVFPYLWFDFDSATPLILWGFPVNPYMTDKATIELMSMIGAVGAAGFLAGTSLVRRKMTGASSCKAPRRNCEHSGTLSVPVFLAYMGLAIGLSWIAAPAETLFSALYAQSESLHSAWNFSSAIMFSYALLVYAVADSVFERSHLLRGVKRKIIVYSILLIVIWFQLLRGDRESLTLAPAVILMYFVWGKRVPWSDKERIGLNWPKIVLIAVIVFAASYFVMNMRFLLIGVGSISDLLSVIRSMEETSAIGTIAIDNVLSGTWSGILLTVLSVSGECINGSLPMKYGQTYLDLVASIVPGFLADWIGYSRPIDSFRGPAWEMIYAGGGIHAVVVPFMNFRMTGVFLIMGLWSFAFTRIEHYSISHLSVSTLALLGVIAMAIPHWIWYGEKNIMNALIIWLILSFFYRLKFRLTSRPLGAMSEYNQHSQGGF